MPFSTVLKSVALVGSVALVWLISFGFSVQYKQSKNRTKISTEKLLSIMEDLTIQFFWKFCQLSEISGEITHKAMEQEEQQKISFEQLKELLLNYFFAEPLLLVEKEVYNKHSVNAEDVEAATFSNATNPDVIKYKNSLQSMCKSAIEGVLPLYPNINIPDALTKEKISEIQAKIYQRKEEKIIHLVEEFFSDRTHLESMSSGDLSVAFNEKVLKANEAAKSEIVAAYVDVCPSLLMFVHAFASYLRCEDFKKKESKFERQHKLNVQSLIKNYQPKSKRKNDIMQEKLECFSSIKKVDVDTAERFLNAPEQSEIHALILIVEASNMMELLKFDSFCSFFASTDKNAEIQYFYIVRHETFTLKTEKVEVICQDSNKAEYFYFIGGDLVNRSFNLNDISLTMAEKRKKTKKQ